MSANHTNEVSLPIEHAQGARYRFSTTQREENQRLDEFLWSQLGWLSRIRIGRLLNQGACLVNGLPALGGHHLSVGESVEIFVEDLGPSAMSPEPMTLDILHEDEHVIVVIKPAGLLVHPSRTVKQGTLINALAYHFNRHLFAEGAANGNAHPAAPQSWIRPGLVHRLDKATSGLMVVAKTQSALSVLTRHMQRRLIEKRYLALVHGIVAQDAGIIRAPIGRDPDQRPRWRVMACGREAETRFTVLQHHDFTTLLELEPVTGRTNQLRIHCAHIGHAIVGDELHGQSAVDEHLPKPERLYLHASRLAFHHPATGQWQEFRSDISSQWSEANGR